ncbi:MAG: hypothetical protein M1455_08070 [Actinobacteria bacterium]|nr:hypothetical protein [Actinomycetota bacterium]
MRRVPAVIAASLVAAVLFSCLTIISACSEPQASAAEALDKATVQFSSAKSYHMQMNGALELTSTGPVSDKDLAGLIPMKLTVSGQADMDLRDPANVRMKMYDLNINGLEDVITRSKGAGGNEAQRALSAGMMTQMLKGMELVVIKDTFYMKMAGSWFSMSPGDIPNSSGMDFSCLYEAGPGEGAQVNSLTGDSFKDIEELPAEDIDGVSTRHFRATLDGSRMADKLDESYAKMQKCGFSQPGPSVGADGYSDIDQVKKLYTTMYDKMQIEYWVDGDMQVRRMAGSMSFNMGEMMAAMGEAAPDQSIEPVTFNFSGTADVSRLGEDFNIAAPEKSIPFKDIANDGFDTAKPTARQAG